MYCSYTLPQINVKISPTKNFRIRLKIQIFKEVVHRWRIIMGLHKRLNVYNYIFICENPTLRITLYNIAHDYGFYDEYILYVNEIMSL